jgi:hypothetical protein
MKIKHPMQDARIRITAGQYEGRTGKVLRVLRDHGAHGFAEIEFTDKRKPDSDLVPLPYIDRSGVRQC